MHQHGVTANFHLIDAGQRGERDRVGARERGPDQAPRGQALDRPPDQRSRARQFLGPLGAASADGSAAALTPLAVAAVVLCFMLGVAALLARPACRRAALEWQGPIRLAAAVALAFMALSSAAAALL